MTKAIRYLTLGALFLIPFLALVVSNTLFFPFITGKNFDFRILVEIAFAGWILLMLIDAEYRPKFSWTLGIFGLFVIWMAIADAFAVNPAKAFWSNFERMDGWITLIHMFALFLVAGSVFTVQKPIANLWRKWWLTFLGVAAVVCLYAFGQSWGLLAIHQGSTRVDATFGNSAYLAAYMLFTFAVALWQGFETKTAKWLRYALFVLAGVSVIVLFLTETRGAILGFLGAVVLGAILWAIESGKKGKQAAAVVLIVVAALVLAFLGLRNTPVVQKIPGVDRLATISLNNGESATRIAIWHMAIKGFEQKPVLGWGQEGFNYIFNTYYNPSLYNQEPWFDRAHDVFLDWLTAGGAPALILFVLLLGFAAVGLYRSKVSRTERIFLISALAAYAFQSLFIFDNLFTYIPLAMILAIAHMNTSRPIQKFNWKPLEDTTFNTVAVPVTAVILVVVLWTVNVPGVRAASDLITALSAQDPQSALNAFKQSYADGSFGFQEVTEQLMSYTTGIVGSSASNADKEAVATYGFQQMQALVTKVPKDARIRLEYALGLRSAGQMPQALQQIHIAEQLSPNKQTILVEEGIEDWENNDTASAKVAFNKAYQLDPSFSDLAAYAAAGDIVSGDVATGKAMLMQAFGTTTVDRQELLVAYYTVKDYPDLIATLRQYVVDQGNSASSEFALAAGLSDAGQYAEARAVIQEAIREHPEAATQGAQLLSQIPAK